MTFDGPYPHMLLTSRYSLGNLISVFYHGNDNSTLVNGPCNLEVVSREISQTCHLRYVTAFVCIRQITTFRSSQEGQEKNNQRPYNSKELLERHHRKYDSRHKLETSDLGKQLLTTPRSKHDAKNDLIKQHISPS